MINITLFLNDEVHTVRPYTPENMKIISHLWEDFVKEGKNAFMRIK